MNKSELNREKKNNKYTGFFEAKKNDKGRKREKGDWKIATK